MITKAAPESLSVPMTPNHETSGSNTWADEGPAILCLHNNVGGVLASVRDNSVLIVAQNVGDKHCQLTANTMTPTRGLPLDHFTFQISFL